jgi:excisionase family DNA binding protein
MADTSKILDYRDPEWVGKRLGLDKNTIYKFLQDGVIPAVHLGRKWLISEARLAEWLEKEAENQTRARREAMQSADRTVQLIDNFTSAARMALKQAHSEARRYGHAYLGQEHLLLGLLSDPDSLAARTLRALAIDRSRIRKIIDEKTAPAEGPIARRLGRNAEAKRAMRLAMRLARRKDQSGEVAVGTDHLLMGILLSRRGLGHEILKTNHITRARLRWAMAEAARGKGENHGSGNSGEGDRIGRRRGGNGSEGRESGESFRE